MSLLSPPTPHQRFCDAFIPRGFVWSSLEGVLSYDRIGDLLSLLWFDVPFIVPGVNNSGFNCCTVAPHLDYWSACYMLSLSLIQPFIALIGLRSSLGALIDDGLPVLLCSGLEVLVRTNVWLQVPCWFR